MGSHHYCADFISVFLTCVFPKSRSLRKSFLFASERAMTKPTLLLHICCAPCATYVVRTLRERFDVVGYFCNPNIHPEEEYALRLREMKRYAEEIGLRMIVAEDETDRWYEATRGTEQEPEGGERCAICYRFRMERAACFAREHGIFHFATTLTISPHKKAAVIHPIGRELADLYGAAFYEADFKKRNGFKISCRMSREAGLYRQDYCGCIFSK
ncbi:MAG: epoxyqueuosine reductase QueH, partial [Candidatus Latescibacteria bacterium]|nr:epoxyqueuosine reductase QueH [Candidatus Latescibacterota bacterium]